MATLQEIFNNVYVAVTNILKVGGAAADNAAAAGNPVLTAGKYNSAAPTYDNGDAATLQTDVNGNLKAVLTGRKLAVIQTDYSQALNVLASGNVLITITPPVGELWRIRGLYFYLASPAGAASGYGQLDIWQAGSSFSSAILRVSSTFGTAIEIFANTISTGTNKWPTTEQAQQTAILNLVATNTSPLYMRYDNLTNATQSGTATIKLTREVEYLVS